MHSSVYFRLLLTLCFPVALGSFIFFLSLPYHIYRGKLDTSLLCLHLLIRVFLFHGVN